MFLKVELNKHKDILSYIYNQFKTEIKMNYYRGKITDIQTKKSDKCGDYLSIKFIYDDEDQQGNIIEKIAYKNFFLNHPNSDLAKKAKQIIYRMKSYFSKNPDQIDNCILKDKQVFITINSSDKYLNVNQVFFIKQVMK